MVEQKTFIHAYSRLPAETIKKIDATKVEPRKMIPEEKYIRKYTFESAILGAVEKYPGFLRGREMFNKKTLKAADNLVNSGIIEEENGIVHKINYDKLPGLFRETPGGKLVEALQPFEKGLTDEGVSKAIRDIPKSTTNKGEISKLLDSGLLGKGSTKENGKWEDIIFLSKYSEEIMKIQKREEQEELINLSNIIEKQFNKKEDPLSITIFELINNRPALKVEYISELAELDFATCREKINCLKAQGLIIAISGEDLGIRSPRYADRRSGPPTPSYIFPRNYFDGKLPITPETKIEIISDIEKTKKEFKEEQKEQE